MGLSMAERKAVTRQMARRYKRASKKEKGRMLDELCALTGWTRRHARRALVALPAKRASPCPRPRIYGEETLVALREDLGNPGRAGGQAPGALHRQDRGGLGADGRARGVP